MLLTNIIMVGILSLTIGVNPVNASEKTDDTLFLYLQDSKSLALGDEDGDYDAAYRLIIISGWGGSNEVKIYKKDSQYFIYWKDSLGGGKNPKFNETHRQLSETEWETFEGLLIKSSFWQMPHLDYSKVGLDGATFILEGFDGGRYHIVNRWSPEDGDFFNICKYLLDVAKQMN